MALTLINPAGLHQPSTYTHVVVGTGSRMVFVAGQVAENEQGSIVSPDFAAQAGQAFANLRRALESAGVDVTCTARITIYVVDLTDELLPAIEAARAEVFGEHKPADALVGVAALAHPGCLIEVDAIAIAEQ
jgi:enamine deaminase RidA (YjgF/YER057c/UK114 family)